MADINRYAYLGLSRIKSCCKVSADRKLFDTLIVFETEEFSQTQAFGECQLSSPAWRQQTEYPLTIGIRFGDDIDRSDPLAVIEATEDGFVA